MLGVVLLGVLVITLFAAVATSGQVRYVEGPPQFAVDRTPPAPSESEPPPPVEPSEIAGRPPLEVPWIVEVIIRAVVTASLVLAVVLVVVYAWRNRPHLRWRRRRRPPPFEPLPDAGDAVAADATAQLAALGRGMPRNAIVECWLRLERAVDDAGVQRRPSDTSTELTERVLAESLADPSALADLAALYREARFSDHQIGEDRREAAIAALTVVHAGLRDRPRRADDAHLDTVAAGT